MTIGIGPSGDFLHIIRIGIGIGVGQCKHTIMNPLRQCLQLMPTYTWKSGNNLEIMF